ncbi:MAG: hypothetical protein HYS81_01750 [Candidatus Aenigmatarchaeota archaeon]|nr:MAG: hypothetical protein HYS81_01750 [Candidatus Aenigmarchaeota archaeon]
MRGVYVLVAMLVLLPAAVEADYFKEYSSTIVLDGKALHSVTALFVSESAMNNITLHGFPRADGLSATIDGKPADVYAVMEDEDYVIVINKTVARGTHRITLAFAADSPAEMTSRGIVFNNAFQSALRIDSYNFTLELPPGAIVAFDDDVPLVSPAARFSTDGQRVRLVWNASIAAGEAYNTFVMYKTDALFLPPLFAAGALVFGYAAYRFRRFLTPKTRTPRPAQRIRKVAAIKGGPAQARKTPLSAVRSTLTQDENAIVEILIGKKGRALQSDVLAETKFSKSKVSKVIRGLEMKEVVSKKPRGRINVLDIHEKYEIDKTDQTE